MVLGGKVLLVFLKFRVRGHLTGVSYGRNTLLTRIF